MIKFGMWLLGNAHLLFKFIIKNWRIALVVLMLLVIWHYKSAYENEKQDFTDYIALVKQESELQAQKNQIVEANTRNAVALEINKHKSIIDALSVDKTQLKKKVGNLYAIKTNADFRLSSYRDLQLLQPAPGNSDPSAESSGDPEQLTSCRRELDTADTRLSVVEEACAVTTADFNLARGWIDGVCSSHKCTNEVSP